MIWTITTKFSTTHLHYKTVKRKKTFFAFCSIIGQHFWTITEIGRDHLSLISWSSRCQNKGAGTIKSLPILWFFDLQQAVEYNVQLSISTGNLHQFLTIITVKSCLPCSDRISYFLSSAHSLLSWQGALRKSYWVRSNSLFFVPSHQLFIEMQKIPTEIPTPPGWTATAFTPLQVWEGPHPLTCWQVSA